MIKFISNFISSKGSKIAAKFDRTLEKTLKGTHIHPADAKSGMIVIALIGLEFLAFNVYKELRKEGFEYEI